MDPGRELGKGHKWPRAADTRRLCLRGPDTGAPPLRHEGMGAKDAALRPGGVILRLRWRRRYSSGYHRHTYSRRRAQRCSTRCRLA